LVAARTAAARPIINGDILRGATTSDGLSEREVKIACEHERKGGNIDIPLSVFPMAHVHNITHTQQQRKQSEQIGAPGSTRHAGGLGGRKQATLAISCLAWPYVKSVRTCVRGLLVASKEHAAVPTATGSCTQPDAHISLVASTQKNQQRGKKQRVQQRPATLAGVAKARRRQTPARGLHPTQMPPEVRPHENTYDSLHHDSICTRLFLLLSHDGGLRL